jgi:hypothetical protein
MSNVFRMVPVMLFVASVAAAGQKPAEQPPKTSDEKEAAARLLNEAAASAARMAAEGAQPVNIQIELTITDQRGDGTPITKTVSMIASDRSWSRIRTAGDVRTPTGFRPVILNVDARPTMLAKDGRRTRVELTIEYRPVAAEADTEKSTTPNVNESLSVILEDGKSMLISQSADPVTDRKVKVEAKAAILK